MTDFVRSMVSSVVKELSGIHFELKRMNDMKEQMNDTKRGGTKVKSPVDIAGEFIKTE